MNNMLMNDKLTYDNRTYSLDNDSDGMLNLIRMILMENVSLLHRKATKKKLDNKDKMLFSSLPTCYSSFLPMIPQMFQ